MIFNCYDFKFHVFSQRNILTQIIFVQHHQYNGIAKETVLKSGGSGGDSVKLLQPTEVEELALAFLGIEKIAGEYSEININYTTPIIKKSIS